MPRITSLAEQTRRRVDLAGFDQPCVIDLIERHKIELEFSGVYQPFVEAKAIIGKVLGLSEAELESDLGRRVDPLHAALIAQAMEIRGHKVPIPRIFGDTAFYGLSLKMAPGVFLAYPETEALVDHALLSLPSKYSRVKILDVGTGSGCVLLALLSALPNAVGVGVDIDDKALDLARENARRHGLLDHASFVHSNWCDGIDEQFDLVVCNPPCVRSDDMERLLPELREHEPHNALDGGEDGLFYYRRLAQSLPSVAKPDARLFAQIGEPNMYDAIGVFENYGFDGIDVKKNYRGAPTCLAVTNRLKPKVSGFQRVRNFFRR